LRNYIFCLPTYYPNEGQPISILEAMANGCAIVTTDHGGIKDVVTKENGIFVGKSNPCDLKNALQSKNLEATMIAKSYTHFWCMELKGKAAYPLVDWKSKRI